MSNTSVLALEEKDNSYRLAAPREEHEIGINETSPRKSTEAKPPAIQRTFLSRILSGRSTVSCKDPGPPPDGGLTAWTQAAMAHLVLCSTWGYISSYGVFQSYYVTYLDATPSSISWVGSLQIFLLFFVGTASGRATDAGLFKPVLLIGMFLQLFGVFMTSLSTKYWQLILAQGVCTGLGNGLQFCPTMSLLSTYFSTHRNIAIGIAASGSAVGGVIFPAIVQQLLPTIGFGWTVRVLGFVMMAMSGTAAFFLKQRLPPRKSGPLIELSAFKETTYLLYCVGMFLNFWGLYFAFYYVGAFGRSIIGIPYSDSISLLMVMNGIGLIGRLIPNFVADSKTGPLNTIIPFTFISSIMIFSWSGVSSRGELWAFACIYGLFSAGIQSLFPATLASLTTDLKKAGVRMGMCFSVVSVACLTGPPLAGALIQIGNGDYLYAQMWAGSSMALGGLTLMAARVAKTGFKFKVKI
ncbi:MFS general substrate transporter [Aulographum hederae CBS 113979]|uniref:MFS general substrate transporter n=1 Tax=Aulographum hederae CBS 113979 TaxID=1176131 RepID=A0A6G1GUE2_9PEZI|nr:MFS general substrate transporter [Aulographum hederae CBS 113979]